MRAWEKYAIPLVMAIVLVAIWSKPLDSLAKTNVESGLERAAITFAAARGLNGLLSLAQSASVGGSVVIAQGSINPGALLEPLDDLVEQFSTLMLWAIVSFGVQRVLLEASASWPLTSLLSVALVAWGLLRLYGNSGPQWVLRTVVVLSVLRLAVPIFAIASEGTYQWLLRDRYEGPLAATQTVVESERPKTDGWIDELRRKWKESKLEELMARADGLVKHLTNLAVVFVVQVIVLPLAFLWLLIALLQGSFRWPRKVSALAVRTPESR